MLDAKRSLFSAELRYAQDQADTLLRAIGLYKALGGGWLDSADAMAVQPQASPQGKPTPFP